MNLLFYTQDNAHIVHRCQAGVISESVIPLADSVKILRVILDKNLWTFKQTGAVRKASYYHLCALRHTCRSLIHDMAIGQGRGSCGCMRKAGLCQISSAWHLAV
jgi:hypothetical protein